MSANRSRNGRGGRNEGTGPLGIRTELGKEIDGARIALATWIAVKKLGLTLGQLKTLKFARQRTHGAHGLAGVNL
jgi:hypothetical protein